MTRDPKRTERGLGTRSGLFQEKAKIGKRTLKIKRAYALKLRRESREAKTGVSINSIYCFVDRIELLIILKRFKALQTDVNAQCVYPGLVQ